ncbi:dihydroneopterin aldolase [Rhodoplanes serenus]|jgi:dihydroneopterin aldolase|uniref:7,8-dihydroneopterin aldolase n=1 Tax=Rhodoplanes serenus TaxID=200615 RepID=A0A327JZM3_9BRAD|nr:dihydroneopterin aldolase [Rhodoplanes serenus]MTW15127.1 dihydroneopterin aldolase [Rhodoplanes serenus]RAI31046.1 dihydroneopterin aldolase [Rhodoplanes serenus]VCU11614.1 Dihydroneopterin aldolase [Rhodoplanes serenus]
MTSASDTIFVTGLAVHAYHGVMEHERTVGQTFLLDLTLTADLGEASRTDRHAATVSYDLVVDCATRAFAAKRFRLVEAAAAAVADAILADFPRVAEVRVTVHKPHAPIPATFTDVGVSIRRARNG